MARRKAVRSIYVTKEPDWKAIRLITEPEEQLEAFKSCEYFVRTEIPKKKLVNASKLWIKEKSGWTKQEIKIIFLNLMFCIRILEDRNIFQHILP